MARRILVTGCTGLVGIHAVNELLTQGFEVTAFVRSADKLAQCLTAFGRDIGEVAVAIGDVCDQASVNAALAGCDAVVHCAGVFSNKRADAEWLRHTNVVGSDIVLRTAVKCGLDPVVHISSYLALFPPNGLLMSADDPVTTPRGTYARTKADAEHIARELQTAGAPVISIYPASIQGPNDPTYGDGSQLIERAIRSKSWITTGLGRSYTDVRDLARLIVATLEPACGPRRYMFSGYFLTNPEVIDILSELTGREIQPQKIPAPVIRGLGRTMDVVSAITKRDFQLSLEGAEVLTRSVPGDDSPAIQEFGLELVGARQSFRDLIAWMLESGKLDPARIQLQRLAR